jgi:hypothetical protein
MGEIPFDVITHVAVVVARAMKTASIYVDGNLVATGPVPSNFMTANKFVMGRAGLQNGAYYFKGILDEIQVSSTLRSSEWLLTSYRNQLQPATFHTIGAEQQSP